MPHELVHFLIVYSCSNLYVFFVNVTRYAVSTPLAPAGGSLFLGLFPVWATLFRRFLIRINRRDDIRDIPKAVSQASGHRRSDAEHLMHLDEVVIQKMQRDGAGSVLIGLE